MFLFTKENMDADKPVPVVNLPPVRFIDGITSQGVKLSIQGAWDPEISVDMITVVCVPVEEDIYDILMKIINVVICMDPG